MKIVLIITLLFTSCIGHSQMSYLDSMQKYLSEYVTNHEVVTAADKQKMQFFPINENFRVMAKFEPILDASWMSIPTSSGKTKQYRKFGKLSFLIDGSPQVLYVYQLQSLLQNPKYQDALFLPFMDATTGDQTYETGRYIDLVQSEISNKKLVIDFNKAYNPYCAYVSGLYSCPVPPQENWLKVAITAGEKRFRKED
ncbi:MAG TPA: DUF1684 domain-containing protein [Niabella sp.]|nr:DUF1684 domain-containing protein [Niabella sp.]HOZ97814.1 DUF1684 domain-containing protein [Niabella sp.]HQW15653.1 DUF1684 domain-containing protein [Niabella sp.]HQX20830.1 DUF1684 domain-containing protein [Niabella sp.]HQX42080.1 DUF1684 domain-containing protein [Niabella sp.]